MTEREIAIIDGLRVVAAIEGGSVYWSVDGGSGALTLIDDRRPVVQLLDSKWTNRIALDPDTMLLLVPALQVAAKVAQEMYERRTIPARPETTPEPTPFGTTARGESTPKEK